MGLFARKDRIELKVEGMTCGGCVRHVTDALQGVSGVSHVDVDLKHGLARVTTKTPIEMTLLTEAVRQAGYTARPA